MCVHQSSCFHPFDKSTIKIMNLLSSNSNWFQLVPQINQIIIVSRQSCKLGSATPTNISIELSADEWIRTNHQTPAIGSE